jgi:5-methylthioadenosine/S-adenosylhomocysteine deaminase
MRQVAAAIGVTLALAVVLVEAQHPKRVSLVITGGTVVTMNTERQVLAVGAVAVDEGAIVGVGEPAAIAARFRGSTTIDAREQVVLPGLINTHTHAPMVLYRGLADDLALMEWLQKYIFPAEAKTVTPEFVRVGTELAALEMIESGTTTFTDMYYFEEEVASAARRAGLRAVVGQTIIQFAVADAPTPREGLARTETFIERWKRDGLVIPAVAPHAVFTNDAATLTAARDLARKHGVPLVIHVAETEDEIKIVREKHQATPVGYMKSLGLLAPNVVAAHGVWLTDEDIGELTAAGVGVAHNPESNMKLASGTAPVPALLARGAKVGLGTDGAASNNDLDMFEAMRQAAFLHKHATRDPRAVPAGAALEMATIGGARVLGLADRIGSIEVGKRADLIAVSMASARQTPLYDPVSHLVYTTRGSDVRTTIVDGRVLMREGQVVTLDRSKVLAAARRMADKVRAVLASPN